MVKPPNPMRPTAFAACVGLLLAGGCATPAPPQSEAEIAAPRQEAPKYVPYVPATQPTPLTVAAEELPTSPRDPQVTPSLIYAVDVWELLLPLESISADEAFWKRVNEQVVDITARDRLDKNGIRVGALPLSDVNFLTDLVEQRKGKKTSLRGTVNKQIELPVNASVEHQTLLFINRYNRAVGHSYDRCSNFFYFSFEPSPRRPNQIRLALTPAVRGGKRRMSFSLTGKTDRELKSENVESLYDANIVLDLPLSDLLVVAPSGESRVTSSLGHAFLIAATPAQRFERVIIVIPKAFRAADDAAAAK